MEDNHHRPRKHVCKFCYKSFACGRSLGGHMRSHMINVSPEDYDYSKDKIPKKKLPSIDDVVGLKLREKKPNRSLKSSNSDTFLLLRDRKLCKECGKSFTTWRALFGHMKSHSEVNVIADEEDDSWDSCSNRAKPIVDSEPDNEAATRLVKRRRSYRSKRYKANTTSSSLTAANFSPSVSEIDQQDEEEVALCLILLSQDNGNRVCTETLVEPLDNIHRLVETKDKVSKSEKFEKFGNRDLKPINSLKTTKSEVSAHTLCADDEAEVNSPRRLIQKSTFDQGIKKKNSRKRMSVNSKDSEQSDLPVDYKNLALSHGPHEREIRQDSNTKIKYECTVCKRSFHSYQALGGHRASHKKIRGSCDPTNSNSKETEASSNPSFNDEGGDDKLIECTKSQSLTGDFTRSIVRREGPKQNKEHECPLCNKVFPSCQSLGGNKRSHVINGDDHQAETRSSALLIHTKNPIKEIRDFIDLNLPATVEDECVNEFTP